MEDPNLDDSRMGTTMQHPAMMETMEDLFGEAADNLNVSLPPVILPAASMLRVAEMQSRGCCTRLAWSSTGSIARITADRSKVVFHTLVRDKRTGGWTLTGDSKHPLEAPVGRRFVHLKFSGIGIDLIVIDDVGASHMYTLAGVLERTTCLGVAREGKSELDAVVGIHWLSLYPAEFRGACMDPAVKNGDRWEFPFKSRDVQSNNRAHNPAEAKNALVQVTRSGEVILLYQNEGPLWLSTSDTLDSLRSSDEFISHAAIGEDGLDLLVVAYDHSSRFRLYRIIINWNPTQHQRAPNVVQTTVAPTLEVRHLTALENVRAQHVDTAKLTHLRLLPSVPEAAYPMPTLPTLFAVFTQISLPTDAGQNQSSFAVISRWHIDTFTPTLHESFKKPKPGSDTSGAMGTVTVLKRQQDVVTNKVILSFDTQMFDKILAFGATDGTVDFRDRATMDPLQTAFGDATRVSSLPQTGFDHLPRDHNVDVAVSADASGLAIVDTEGNASAHVMNLTHGWQIVQDEMSDNRPFIDAAIACVARQFAILCYQNASNDESLALVPSNADSDVRSRIVRNIYKILNRSPDLLMQDGGKQQMFVFRDALIPRALSASLSFGTSPTSGERNCAAQLAFIVLNIRLLAQALAPAIGINRDVKSMPPEIFASLGGQIRWATDLIIHIMDTITTVQRDMEPNTSSKKAFDELRAKSGSPVMQVLLSTFSRALLRLDLAWIMKYFQAVQQVALPRARTIAEKKELTGLLELASTIPFRYHEFEKMLQELDQAVKDAWVRSGVPAEQRAELEGAMLCDGEIPNELEPAIDTLLNTILPKLKETMDIGKLYFWNTDRLSIACAKPRSGQQQLDIIRKTPIPKDAPIRLCRRCGSVTEDVTQERARELPNWLQHVHRHCVCMNFWILP
ncbi:Hypothetical predicted protein [Lecanosticta acicola]|uniref:Mediator of RNA polymerase II transcription subunit 16 n=1 Tax=Lecanosticta acicola TaxID=111012 RepID=A0AAI8Z026_9PEZI|nr:Hypothetical predicted protein [Lecanosticta acicola]